ncbi:hypothetical protein [Sporolactobacillus spathodeae]|uniref:Uncharacterized membrane protein HdeD (DUF308 family) n=1 Tax=Sporolactobacillus spathodeae TaxID=1465502 RepID=A0ABS2QBE6_9BACL|nr:hypothetical protein [Sporolactobacillus spathodeae]MBM7659132.1 uncharacterized membrane protein HdeD (DUF308 family) [Sporolactobacillus spathodeae]
MGNIIIQILGIVIIIGAILSLFKKHDRKTVITLLIIGIVFLADGIIGKMFFEK